MAKDIKPAMKPAEEKRKRLPRSVRKHIRRAKAALRREHASADAEKAIEQLVMKLRE
jgi:hypothetical protein